MIQLDPDLASIASDALVALARELRQNGLPDRAGALVQQAAEIQLMSPALQACWGGPFNGQAGRTAIVEQLLREVAPQAIVETGTFRGISTHWFAEHAGSPVWSCEAEDMYLIQARHRLAGVNGVVLERSDSRAFLRRIVSSLSVDTPSFFYLDAHWEEDLPLREEISIIFAAQPRAIVMIDDFRIPEDPGYTWDDYGPGVRVDATALAGVLPEGASLYIPALASAEETGAKRGCCIVAWEAAEAVERCDLLKRRTLSDLMPDDDAASTSSDHLHPNLLQTGHTGDALVASLQNEIRKINLDRVKRLQDSNELRKGFSALESSFLYHKELLKHSEEKLATYEARSSQLERDLALAKEQKVLSENRMILWEEKLALSAGMLALSGEKLRFSEKRLVISEEKLSLSETVHRRLRDDNESYLRDNDTLRRQLVEARAQIVPTHASPNRRPRRGVSLGADQIGSGEGDKALVELLYHAVLGRDVEEDALDTRLQALAGGVPFADMFKEVATSEEARQESSHVDFLGIGEASDGSTGTLSVSDRTSLILAIVECTYKYILKRKPTSSEAADWAANILSGLSIGNFWKAVVGSEEARVKSGSPGIKENLESAEAERLGLVRDAVRFAYAHFLRRTPTADDLAHWSGTILAGMAVETFLSLIAGSEEARLASDLFDVAATLSDGQFLMAISGPLFGRGLVPTETVAWQRRLEAGNLRRGDMVCMVLNERIRAEAETQAKVVAHDSDVCYIMGTSRLLSRDHWEERAEELRLDPKNAPVIVPLAERTFQHTGEYVVSMIASLYRGGAFIEKFLENIVSQTLFDRSELIIIDANSPEGEREIIEAYQRVYPNIVYKHINYRLGIYDAWNVGVEMSRGRYLTNTNLDDLRRRDSIELQAALLDAKSDIDVVYQDFYYSFDPTLTFEEVEAFGFKSDLPILTPNNLLLFNSPHNAPMWRKNIHDQVGLFDTRYKSAGDHDFWARCLSEGKRFGKINTPHVVYYQNPVGMSTRPNTRGIEEGRDVLRRYGPKLMRSGLLQARNDLYAGLGIEGGPQDADKGQSYYETIQGALIDLGRRRRSNAAVSSRNGSDILASVENDR